MENPFVVKPYKSSELFCDRVSETAHVSSLLLSGDNVTLISPRRYGKTGLIYRVFDEIKSKHRKIVTCYVDIYSANNLEDFVKLFSEAVVASAQENSLVKKFFSAMGGVRPLLSFDSITGAPQVSIAYQNENQKVATLKSIFDFLETQKNKVIVAIDEFQQIRAFPNVKMEALLRTYIQPLKNISFVFCGRI
ncbi:MULTISPECIES: P-loop NTPase fold protein [unclassified Fibrobacter]|uniref:P-loop NTPase fold protein n=1 Tax=unclassified Fibrobacter TaxID=2634177 RepID=UPI000D6D1718|nr:MULTISPECIES: P-loop NTPase fold protein [unclassified Fibrobacter]PWJ68477.1 putative ATPase [Fibrobacter sp. UWR4]PZW72131.1 putative ATPase [Fibrobacter sp. UWR1]